MVRRNFPKGNEEGVTFTVFPTLIADEYWYHGESFFVLLEITCLSDRIGKCFD